MEKFIYRLAIFTHNAIEEMLPYYFVDEATALGFAELYVRGNWSNHSSILGEYNPNKTCDLRHCLYYKEPVCSRWYRFDFLYQDKRASIIRYLAITRIALYQ